MQRIRHETRSVCDIRFWMVPLSGRDTALLRSASRSGVGNIPFKPLDSVCLV